MVETAALAHDIGPPAPRPTAARLTTSRVLLAAGFEGNAQTLRILTRLEAKSVDAAGRSVGLNLTRATLDASTKYPWPRTGATDPRGVHADGTASAVRKFGVYDDDLPVFTWMRAGAEPGRRCLEAQVMDLSDDVAYSVHDLEDAVVAGRIDLSWLRDAGRRREVWGTVRDWYLPDASDAELDEALDALSATGAWPTAPYDGSRSAQAALKNLTSDLIGRFCTSVQHATHEKYGTGPLVRYDADLVVPRATGLEIGCLKGIAAHYVMRADDRVSVMVTQRESWPSWWTPAGAGPSAWSRLFPTTGRGRRRRPTARSGSTRSPPDRCLRRAVARSAGADGLWLSRHRRPRAPTSRRSRPASNASVELLVDVPVSRQPRQPRRRQGRAPDLAAGRAWTTGGRSGSAGRRKLPTDDTQDPWQVDAFRATLPTRTAEFREALAGVLAETEGRRVAVMCSESVWWRCHRRVIADVAVLMHGVAVRHLMHDGRLTEHAPSQGARLREDGLVVWDVV
jgi:hypothetical protein